MGSVNTSVIATVNATPAPPTTPNASVNVTPAPPTTTSSWTAWDSSSGSSDSSGKSLESLMSSSGSLNEGSSVFDSSLPGHSSGDSSGSNASWSSGSIMQVWQWLLALAL